MSQRKKKKNNLETFFIIVFCFTLGTLFGQTLSSFKSDKHKPGSPKYKEGECFQASLNKEEFEKQIELPSIIKILKIGKEKYLVQNYSSNDYTTYHLSEISSYYFNTIEIMYNKKVECPNDSK